MYAENPDAHWVTSASFRTADSYSLLFLDRSFDRVSSYALMEHLATHVVR
jgi:hypothetical protein